MLTLSRIDMLITRIRQDMDKTEWVLCPACKSEWTKLHPCPFFKFDGKRRTDDVTWLCIECAETLKGFEFVTTHWPIKKPDADWNDDWIRVDTFWPHNSPRYDEVPSLMIDPETGEKTTGTERMWRWGDFQARVRAWTRQRDSSKAGADYMIKAGNGNVLVVDSSDPEMRIPFDNTVAAWHWMHTKIPAALENYGAMVTHTAPTKKFPRTR